jgi:hypothetical protein
MGKRSRNEPPDAGMIDVMASSVDGEVTIEPAMAPASVPASVAELIGAVAESVVPAARAAGPDKFGVEFGIRTRRDGSASLVEDPAKATFRVFMEWSADRG